MIADTATHESTNFGSPYKQLSKSDRRIGPSGAPRRHYRTIWISDVHLGTRGCNAELLIDFLDHSDSDQLYLVGDIIDGWRMKKNSFGPNGTMRSCAAS